MILFLSTEAYVEPFERLNRSLSGALDGIVRPMTYEQLFFTGRAPIGHVVFTDLDRLSRYERDIAASFARTLLEREPRARVLNAPDRVLDRVPLLRALKAAGVNDFSVWQLGLGERPTAFPVFIRPADGHSGPETRLLKDAASFARKLAGFEGKRLPLANRIAVQYAAEPSADGFFRKFGVFNIGGRLVPQHVMRGRRWMLKNRENRVSGATAKEELAFVRENPHKEVLERAFAVAGIDFGRVDYGLVGGRPQIYEINTNPFFPRFEKEDLRTERRELIRERLIAAFEAIDQPLASSGSLAFKLPTPRAHTLRLPRRGLVKGLASRLADRATSSAQELLEKAKLRPNPKKSLEKKKLRKNDRQNRKAKRPH